MPGAASRVWLTTLRCSKIDGPDTAAEVLSPAR